MIHISISIMAVPERYAFVKRNLLPFLPGAKVFLDQGRQGTFWNALRCHRNIDKDTTHVLVLQDDVVLCKDFMQSVYELVKSVPDRVISLYCPHREAVDLLAAGKHWIKRNAITAQAQLMPVELEIQWQLWESINIPERSPKLGDDFRLSWYLHKTGQFAWYCVPSLVQHTGSLSSTFGYNNALKYSKVFLGTNKSGVGIDWLAGLETAKKLTYLYSAQEKKQYGL